MKNKFNLKNTIRWILGVPTGIYMIYSVYFFIMNPIHPTRFDCGVVKSKSANEVAIKYGVNTMLYLNIDFKQSGFRSINVGPTTYFKYKEGDNLCFDVKQERHGSYCLFGMSGMIIIVLGSAVGLTFLLMYLFTDFY